MLDFIHSNKALYGVDAICKILPIAASTYYRTLYLAEYPEHRAKRDLHDLHHTEQIKQIWKDGLGRYGARKVWQQLKNEGYVIARCTVVRLMRKLGLQGIWRGKNKQTTRSRDDQNEHLTWLNVILKRIIQITCGLLTSLIFKLIPAGSIPHLLLMCSHEQLLGGKYRHV